MESIDALAEAINAFEGGMILVSHDFRLVSQVSSFLYLNGPLALIIFTFLGCGGSLGVRQARNQEVGRRYFFVQRISTS